MQESTNDSLPVHMLSSRSVMLALSSCLILGLAASFFVYRMIWGFGGFYTHVRYIPAPDQLIVDEATSLTDIDAQRGQRHYQVANTVDELVLFNQQELPKMGWRIVAEGPNPPSLSEHPYYCIIAEQRGVKAYILIRQGKTPAIADARISIEIPNSLCEHLLE